MNTRVETRTEIARSATTAAVDTTKTTRIMGRTGVDPGLNPRRISVLQRPMNSEPLWDLLLLNDLVVSCIRGQSSKFLETPLLIELNMRK